MQHGNYQYNDRMNSCTHLAHYEFHEASSVQVVLFLFGTMNMFCFSFPNIFGRPLHSVSIHLMIILLWYFVNNKTYITQHVSYWNTQSSVLHERCKNKNTDVRNRNIKNMEEKQKGKQKPIILMMLNREKHQVIPLKKLVLIHQLTKTLVCVDPIID